MPKLRFTKRAIDALPYPEKGQVLHRDEIPNGPRASESRQYKDSGTSRTR